MDAFHEYEEHDAVGLAQLIRDGQISGREAVEAAITRIERRNPPLNAVITTTFDHAERQLANGIGDGPFAGVPFLLKGLGHALQGVRLTEGSRALRNWVSPYTATLVQRFQDAGLVILGVTNVPEIGLSPVTEPAAHGVCANPWDTSRTPGGSSGGSGAAVAAGMVPAAAASDGGGSIRIPASHCGLFGLKPTRARTPHGPVQVQGLGLSVNHALTRSVRDSAALLDVTHGPEPGDPNAAPPPARPFLDEVGADPGRLRIGVIDGGILSDDIDPACRAALAGAIPLLEHAGHEVVPTTLPIDRTATVGAFLTLMVASARATISAFATMKGQRAPHPADYELSTRFAGAIGRKLTADRVIEALNHMHVVGRTVGAAMVDAGIDLIMTSTLASPPLAHHELDPAPAERRMMEALCRVPFKPFLMAGLKQMAAKVLAPMPNSPLFNMTGQPAMSVPLHWTADNLPVGVQFAGRFGDEATLLRLAAQLEAARPWFNRRPPSIEQSTIPVTSHHPDT